MVKASAYTVEDVARRLDDAFGMFIDGDEGYIQVLEEVRTRLQELTERYPKDDEVAEFLQAFESYLKAREEGMSREDEKARLVWLKSELNHIVHWRKLGMSAGRVLPFKDFRSLRGGTGGR